MHEHDQHLNEFAGWLGEVRKFVDSAPRTDATAYRDACAALAHIERLGATARACRVCGEGFIVSVMERAWFSNHGMSLPTRCPECRAARRARRENARGNEAGQSDANNITPA